MSSLVFGNKVLKFPFFEGQTEALISDGRFSVIDLVEEIAMSLRGPRLSAVSWTAGVSTVSRLLALRNRVGLQGRFVFDRVLPSVKPVAYRRLHEGFGIDNIRLLRTHLKLYIVHDAVDFYALESSANLNRAVRLEFFRITKDAEQARRFLSFIDSIFSSYKPPPVKGSPKFHVSDLKRLFAEPKPDDGFDFLEPGFVDVD